MSDKTLLRLGDLLRSEDANVLVGVAMTLTGGTVNPAALRERLDAYRSSRNDAAIADPAEIARYMASARELFGLSDSAIELSDPPVVLRTPTGARVMAWLPVEDEDLTA